MRKNHTTWLAAFLLGLGCLLVAGAYGVRAQETKGNGKTDDGKSETVFSKTDALSKADAKDTKLKDSHRKLYKIKLLAGKAYRIDVTSKEFDTFLRLENSAGKEVAFNDDVAPPNNLNSRVIYYTPKTGEYRVIVTTYDGGKTGSFDLEIKTANLVERIQIFADYPTAEQKKLIQEVTRSTEAKDGKLSMQDANNLIGVFRRLDDSEVAFARETGRTFAKIVAGADNQKVAGAAKIIESELAKLNRVGKELQITGKTTDGKDFDLKNHKGKVVLVDFWATWCGPCVGEIPNIVEAHKKYHAKGFEVIGVSLDETNDAIVKFIEARHLPWKCINVEDSKKLTQKYGVNLIPSPMLVGPDGRVVSLRARGPQLDRLLARLIGEKK
jgi:thiol-disulfide isomerase/thioredoxin